MRDLDKVISAILAVVPCYSEDGQTFVREDEKNEDLIRQLRSVRSSVLYKPPESMWECWRELHDVLLPITKKRALELNEWEAKVVSIYADYPLRPVPQQPFVLLQNGKPVNIGEPNGISNDSATVFDVRRLKMWLEETGHKEEDFTKVSIIL